MRTVRIRNSRTKLEVWGDETENGLRGGGDNITAARNATAIHGT